MAWSAGAVLTAAQLNTYLPQTWTAYTPTLSGGLTLGSGTALGRYIRLGGLIYFRASLTLGAGFTAPGGAASISLPVARSANQPAYVGSGHGVLLDASTGNFYTSGFLFTTTANLYVHGTNGLLGSITSTSPFTWATDDAVLASGVYEAA